MTWAYVHRILIPWSGARDRQKNEIKSQMWDLYPRWVGARDLFLYGKNPYSPEVSHEIQAAFYGRAATPQEESAHLIDEQRFAYPVYVVFLMAPTVRLDFATVQRWAPLVLGLFAALAVVFSVRLLDWHFPWPGILALVAFTLSSPQIVQGMRHQQLAIVVASLLIVAAWSVHREHLTLAGVLLAWTTIKPQMALLPLVWFLLWGAAEWRARWRLLASFAGTMLLLVGAGEFLVPGWIGEFISAMSAYQRYFPTTSTLRMLLGDTLGILLSIALLIWVSVFAWRTRRSASSSSQFSLTFAAFLMTAVLTFPLFTPFNQALLILPALMVVRDWVTLSRVARIIFITAIAWPWITSAALLVWNPPLNPARSLILLPAVAATAMPLILPLLLMSTVKADSVKSSS